MANFRAPVKAPTKVDAKSAFQRKTLTEGDLARVDQTVSTIAQQSGRRADGEVAAATQAMVPPPPANGVYEVGRIYSIPHSKLVRNPVGPRITYAETDIEEMVTKLRADGQREAISAFVRSRDGAIVISDGGTRHQAAPRVPLDNLLVEIQDEPAGDRELYERAYSANRDRTDHTPLDDAIRWADFLERGIYANQQEIVDRLHRSKTEVSRILQLIKLPSKLRITATEFPNLRSLKMLSAIREYFEATGEDEMRTHELILDAGQKEWGYRDVETRRASLNNPVKRTRSEKQPFSYDGVRGELRAFPEKGRVELSIKGLKPEKALDLQAKLREWLGTSTDGS